MSRIPPVYCKECNNKRLYRSEIRARDGLARLIRDYGEGRLYDYSMNVFPCPHHPNNYHFGHSGKTIQIIEKARKNGNTVSQRMASN